MTPVRRIKSPSGAPPPSDPALKAAVEAVLHNFGAIKLSPLQVKTEVGDAVTKQITTRQFAFRRNPEIQRVTYEIAPVHTPQQKYWVAVFEQNSKLFPWHHPDAAKGESASSDKSPGTHAVIAFVFTQGGHLVASGPRNPSTGEFDIA